MTRSTPSDHTPDDDLAARLDALEPRPGMEPLTAEEKDAFLARVRAQGRALTSAEQYALFGPPREAAGSPLGAAPPPPEVEEMQPAYLDAQAIARLRANFFPELGDGADLPAVSLVRGVIFDLDGTLAELARPLSDLMHEGAQAAAAFMRSTGMDLPDDFATNIVEARRFSEEKSEEEQEEHIADDAMSFLLQFFGYPASRMEPETLRRAVDIFYAPEMTAWRLRPGAQATLTVLQAAGYKLALIANYNCDRVFQRSVDYLGLRPYFDICLSSAAVEFRKPNPRLFEIALTRWDVLPYEVVVVGDSLRHDIRGGLATGALTVFMEGAVTPQVAFDNAQVAADIAPDARLDDLAQLPARLAAWATP